MNDKHLSLRAHGERRRMNLSHYYHETERGTCNREDDSARYRPTRDQTRAGADGSRKLVRRGEPFADFYACQRGLANV